MELINENETILNIIMENENYKSILNNIMENEYYNFMKKWNKENNMSSFYGSNKQEFLKEWAKTKVLLQKEDEAFMTINEKKEKEDEFKNKTIPSMFEEQERNLMNLEDINIKKEEPIKNKGNRFIKKGTKEIFTLTDEQKKKIKNMSKDERITYIIKMSKKNDELKIPNNIKPFIPEWDYYHRSYIEGGVKGYYGGNNINFKKDLLRIWMRQNNKKINNIDKLITEELNKALEERGINSNEQFKNLKEHFKDVERIY